MIRDVEQENLRGADQQRRLRACRVRGKRPVERGTEQRAQAAEAPQHGADQLLHQGAVAVIKGGEIAVGVRPIELLVERPAPLQHAIQDLRRRPPRGQSGRCRRRCGFGRGHDGRQGTGTEKR